MSKTKKAQGFVTVKRLTSYVIFIYLHETVLSSAKRMQTPWLDLIFVASPQEAAETLRMQLYGRCRLLVIVFALSQASCSLLMNVSVEN